MTTFRLWTTFRLCAAAGVLAALSACATTRLGDDARLSLYRANAGAPVDHFRYYGSLNGWTPLGDGAIALWTRPSEAYLVEFFGPCQGVDYAATIGVSSSMGRVNAKFDKVLVRNAGRVEFPCTIREIRPLDVAAVRGAERALRDQPAPGAGDASGT